MSTELPVFGLRPFRELRSRTRKLPNPRSSIFSPRFSVSVMLSKMISTNCSASFFVMSASFATFSTRSAFVIVYSPKHVSPGWAKRQLRIEVQKLLMPTLFPTPQQPPLSRSPVGLPTLRAHFLFLCELQRPHSRTRPQLMNRSQVLLLPLAGQLEPLGHSQLQPALPRPGLVLSWPLPAMPQLRERTQYSPQAEFQWQELKSPRPYDLSFSFDRAL